MYQTQGISKLPGFCKGSSCGKDEGTPDSRPLFNKFSDSGVSSCIATSDCRWMLPTSQELLDFIFLTWGDSHTHPFLTFIPIKKSSQEVYEV